MTMSMPIQRQSESYHAFTDGPRFARDRVQRDLPPGLAGLVSGGPRISAGLNNPRGIRHHADAYEAPGLFDKHGPYGSGVDSYGHEAEPDFDPRQYGDDSPHGPEPHVDEHGHPLDVDEGSYVEDLSGHGHPDVAGFGFGGYDDYDPHSVENLPPDYDDQFGPHMASFTQARHHEADGPAPALFTPMLFQPGERLDARSELLGGEKAFVNDEPLGELAEGQHWVTGAAVQPQVVPGWVGHGYVPGHRVGLPWRDTVIPGTVTHLDGQQVGIRWDDGQHTTEEPADLRPL
ncbi:hypothetical protein BI081_gp218 [Mycobacterium phage Tonenili]|uniref:Uncharacterized protein n=1 Tax=Mycobacterium phage Tonenili TaxID=1891703 RepID=A0A1C9EHB4_9CAUD|nr:hypothetical protein BI081_gp218 [Mycobacterium phage Tonenili]AON96889.1 hypothetical protein SEA_TONENILI_142 [Mycobacterium phage Tonenili]